MPGYDAYAYDGDHFYGVHLDAQGRISGPPEEVGAEEAVPRLVHDYLNNQINQANLSPGQGSQGSTVPVEHFVQGVIVRADTDIQARTDLTADERHQLLRQLYGDRPEIVRLAVQALGDEAAAQIWGIQRVQRYTQNDGDPSSATPVPANVIQNVQSQGSTPPPPQSQDAAQPSPSATGQGGSSPIADSGGQGTSSSPHADPRTGGDPLILFSGQLYYQVVDLELRGLGPSVRLVRTYLSQTLYRGPLGYGWDHSYNLWLREERELQPDGNYLNVVYRSTGAVREDRFVQRIGEVTDGGLDTVVDAAFDPPPGCFDVLTKAGGQYSVRTTTGTVLHYAENLYVERVVDGYGNALSFDYDELNRLAAITDAVGKTLRLGYDELNRIATVTDVVGGRELRYGYGDNGDLEEVDLFAGDRSWIIADYRYSGPDLPADLQHNLTAIVGADARTTLECSYGSDAEDGNYNRVVWQRSGDGEYSYRYLPLSLETTDPDTATEADLLSLARTATVVTYPSGHLVEHRFNAQGNVVQRLERVPDAAGLPVLLQAFYTYNADGLLTVERPPIGGGTRYWYGREDYEASHGTEGSPDPDTRATFADLRRVVLDPRDGSDGDRRIVLDYAYHAEVRQPTRRRGPYYADVLLHELPGQQVPEAWFSYDSAGNPTEIRSSPVSQADGTSRLPNPVRYERDGSGRLIRIIAGSTVTVFRYFPDRLRSGFVAGQVTDPDGGRRTIEYQVDDLGRELRRVDVLGAERLTSWEPFDAPAQLLGPAMGEGGSRPEVNLHYDARRRLRSSRRTVVGPDGELHAEVADTFSLDDWDRIVAWEQHSATDGSQRSLGRSYGPSGEVLRERDWRGTLTVHRYDQRNHPVETIRAWGTAVASGQQARRNGQGEVVALVDPRGEQTQLERDSFGRIRRVLYPDGTENHREYDASGNVLRERVFGLHPSTGSRVRWSERSYRYDGVGLLITRTDHLFLPGDSAPDELMSTQYRYTTSGLLEQVQAASGRRISVRYDAIGRPLQQDDTEGELITHEYSPDGRQTSTVRIVRGTRNGIEERLAFRTRTVVNALGLLESAEDAAGNAEHRRYDSDGRLVEFIDSGGARRVLGYDALGRLAKDQLAVAGDEFGIEYSHDAGDALIAIRSSAGQTSSWILDELGRDVEFRHGGVFRSRSSYDAAGNLIEWMDGNGVVQRHSYGPANRLRRTSFDTGSFVPVAGAPGYRPAELADREFSYTPTGSLAGVTTATERIWRSFDSLDRILTEEQDGLRLSWSYDVTGARSGFGYPGGRRLAFERTPGGSLTTVRQLSAGVSYPGDPAAAGARVLVRRELAGEFLLRADVVDLASADHHFDAAGRRLAADHRRDGVNLYTEGVIAGARGEPLVWQSGDVLRIPSYDAAGRLIRSIDYRRPTALDLSGLEVADMPPAPGEPPQAALDAKAQDIVAAVSGDPLREVSYELDTAGNRRQVSSTETGAPPLVVGYTADTNDEYRLVGGESQVYDGAGNLVSDGSDGYRYDARGLLREILLADGRRLRLGRDALDRVRLVDDGSTSTLLVSDGNSPVEWRRDGEVLAQVVPGDEPGSVLHAAAAGLDQAPILDRLGSPVGWVGSDGGVRGRRWYSDFGGIIEQAGPPASIPLGFTGGWLDGMSGLVYLGARELLCAQGRFLQPDPSGFSDGWNVYSYARHAPAVLVDRLGLNVNPIDWGQAAASAVGTLATGALFIAGGSIAVAAGLMSAPVVALVGAGMLLYSLHDRYQQRRDQAIQAGYADPERLGAAAAVLDVAGVGGIYQGVSGRDLITRRPLSTQARSQSLGQGVGTVATIVLARPIDSASRGGYRWAIRPGQPWGRLFGSVNTGGSTPAGYNGQTLPLEQVNCPHTTLAGNSTVPLTSSQPQTILPEDPWSTYTGTPEFPEGPMSTPDFGRAFEGMGYGRAAPQQFSSQAGLMSFLRSRPYGERFALRLEWPDGSGHIISGQRSWLGPIFRDFQSSIPHPRFSPPQGSTGNFHVWIQDYQ